MSVFFQPAQRILLGCLGKRWNERFLFSPLLGRCTNVGAEQRRFIRALVRRKSLWKPRIVLIPKVPAIKRKWQLAAEMKFLKQREEVPAGAYAHGFSPLHLASLDPHLRRVLDLNAAPLKALSECRKRLMRDAVGRNVFDTRSHAVQGIGVVFSHTLTFCRHQLGDAPGNVIFREN